MNFTVGMVTLYAVIKLVILITFLTRCVFISRPDKRDASVANYTLYAESRRMNRKDFYLKRRIEIGEAALISSISTAKKEKEIVLTSTSPGAGDQSDTLSSAINRRKKKNKIYSHLYTDHVPSPS